MSSALFAAAPALAANYVFSYTGAGLNASGSFATTDASDANGYFTITSLMGIRNGVTINSFLPAGSIVDSQGDTSDNLFKPTDPRLTFNGFAYTVQGSNNIYNLYNGPGYTELTYTGTTAFQTPVTSFVTTAAAAPEPAAWGLMIGGFVVVGGMSRRRRRTMAAAGA